MQSNSRPAEHITFKPHIQCLLQAAICLILPGNINYYASLNNQIFLTMCSGKPVLWLLWVWTSDSWASSCKVDRMKSKHLINQWMLHLLTHRTHDFLFLLLYFGTQLAIQKKNPTHPCHLYLDSNGQPAFLSLLGACISLTEGQEISTNGLTGAEFSSLRDGQQTRMC